MGVNKLQEELEAAARAAGKSEEDVNNIYLDIRGVGCHSDVVRKHLNSGALADCIKVWETKMLAIPNGSEDDDDFYDMRGPCYTYILLGACAMELGCHLPESFLDMLKIVYTEGGFLAEALEQLHKALFGPDGFKNGQPYDFESKGLIDTMSDAMSSDAMGGPGSMFGPSRSNSIDPTILKELRDKSGTNSVYSTILKELRDKRHNPGVCAECSASHGEGGSALLLCARCKDRKYCSSVCQKKHWKIHKKLCKPSKT